MLIDVFSVVEPFFGLHFGVTSVVFEEYLNQSMFDTDFFMVARIFTNTTDSANTKSNNKYHDFGNLRSFPNDHNLLQTAIKGS